MPLDYARRRPVSRLRREEKKRALRTSLIFLVTLGIFGLLFIIFGINLLAKFSLLISHLRRPNPTPIIQDVIPPSAPQLSAPPPATSSAVISLNGFAEPKSRVKLFVNGSSADEMATPDSGEISFPEVVLTSGLNTIYALAYDEANNESARSDTVTVIVDEKAPDLTIDNPKDGAIFYGSVEKIVNLKGVTDPEASLSVNGKIIVVSPDGNFSSQYELQEGNNTLHFVAQDAAGNQKAVDLNVSYSP